MRNSGIAFATALGLAFIAWSGTQLYVSLCAPSGVYGFLVSLVTMDSSPCQALFSVMSHSQTLYSAMIASLLFALFGVLASCVTKSQQMLPYQKNIRN